MSAAVGYCRISVADQSNNSLSNQAQGITDYCRNNNITLEKIFTDNGKSAFTFDRPEWLKLEAYLKKNKHIAFLVVYHIDRFSRATLMDALIKLNEIEVKLKVKVLTVTDPVNMDSSDLGVQLMRTINLLFANNERNRIQDRVKDGMYRSMASGRCCNKAPLGYKNSRDASGKPLLIIDPVKAPLIKKVFKLFNQGVNVERIRKEVPGLKLVGNSSIQGILSNSLYAGIINLPAYKGKPAMEIDAIHEPIVAKYEYYAAVNKLDKRYVSQPKEEVWLRGSLHCHCGRLMTAGKSTGRHGKRYWYYLCNSHRDKSYPAIKMHDQFLKILDVLSLDEQSVEFIRAKLLQSIEQHQSKKGGNIMKLKLELSKIMKKIEDAQVKFLLNPTMDAEVYSRVISELKEQQYEVEEKIAKFSTETSKLVELLNRLLPKLHNLSESFTSMDLNQKHLFILVCFSRSLSYFDGIYRTAELSSIFAHKALELKEKHLLNIEQVSGISEEIHQGSPNGSCTQPLFDDLEQLLRVWAA